MKKIKLSRKLRNTTSGIKASSTLPITIGKKMTKQGSLPSSLLLVLVEEKIERFCGVKTSQCLVLIGT